MTCACATVTAAEIKTATEVYILLLLEVSRRPRDFDCTSFDSPNENEFQKRVSQTTHYIRSILYTHSTRLAEFEARLTVSLR